MDVDVLLRGVATRTPMVRPCAAGAGRKKTPLSNWLQSMRWTGVDSKEEKHAKERCTWKGRCNNKVPMASSWGQQLCCLKWLDLAGLPGLF